MKHCALFLLCLLACGPLFADAATYKAAVVRGDLPGYDAAAADALSAQVRTAGYEVVPLDVAALKDAASYKDIDLLVLPNASCLPAAAVEPLTVYLKQGGDLMALNAPLGHTLYVQDNGRWRSTEELQRVEAERLPAHVLWDFSPASISTWVRTHSPRDGNCMFETVPEGPAPGRRSLHVKLDNYQGWDNVGEPDVKSPFPAGHTLTVFAAKGGELPHSLAVEWKERDGSRWIAVVRLSREWRRFVLRPEDFKYWESVPARAGTKFNPANADRLAIGLAASHTSGEGGPQEYWVSGFGTDAATADCQAQSEGPTIQPLEALAPSYKFYEPAGVVALRAVAGSTELPTASSMRCLHPRPNGAGFDKNRDWRWVPLVEAYGDKGAWRGEAAVLLVHLGGKFTNGQWASFGVSDPAWYQTPAAQKLIADTAARMRRGVHFLDAGAEFFTCLEGQPVNLGARVINVGHETQDDTLVRVEVKNAKTGKTAVSWQWPLALAADTRRTVSKPWTAAHWPKGGYRVEAQLLAKGEVVDSVSHEFNVWKPKRHKDYVTIKNADFVLDGQRWRPHGVNYMPSSGIGTEDFKYFEHWMSAQSYDAVIIDRDLRHIRDMGMNAVSIFLYYESLKEQNILDILRRCDALGLKANLSLRHATAFEFPVRRIQEMITYARLADNDTVFAYDIDWEPLWRKHEDRVRWDGEWEAWVVERYGSIENAEKDWAYPIPRDKAGKITNPSVKEVDQDGDWRRMTAAYRRFLDTTLYKYYSRARAAIREVDKHHPVSFRMTDAGNPTLRWDGYLAYDYPYLAAAVDLLEPEAYGRIGDWDRVKPGWFEYEYARCMAPRLPVMWAEAGNTAWDMGTMSCSPSGLVRVGNLYRDTYRMVTSSGADGLFWWWYPGGFRVGENSDFGLINPDGTDRPQTTAVRECGKAFENGPDARPVDHWITIDRDKQADALAGIYDAVQAEFWKAINDGKVPGLKAEGQATTSADCPLLAVGNTECNGSNPAKYLDGYFDKVEVKNAKGEWQAVAEGGSVVVAANKPVAVRVKATNLGFAKWLAKGPGAVGSTVSVGATTTTAPLKRDVENAMPASFSKVLLPVFAETKTSITLSFKAEGRVAFGQKFSFFVRP